MMNNYSDFYNLKGDNFNIEGDNFNIEAVCPDYLPESQCTFTWHRDERGVAIVSGYDPEQDISTDWLCWCGHYETGGGRCTHCGNDAPWGADDGYDDEYDPDMDFGYEFDPYEGTYEPALPQGGLAEPGDYDGMPPEDY